MQTNQTPALPYNGHSGYVKNSDTSTDRALQNDADGTTNKHQQFVLETLFKAGTDGHTWFEIDSLGSNHHGITSGALSALHKTGEVFMLKAKRTKSHIYVHDYYRNAFTENSRIDRPVNEARARYLMAWIVATGQYQNCATRQNEIAMLKCYDNYVGEL